MKIKLAKTELIHFIGIGGIGMSGLALIMKGKGFRVQGSDISINKNIERLKKEKIKVLEDGVLISESFNGTCYPPNTDVATLNSEVAAIANVVWTQSVKDAYAAAFPTQPIPEE